MVATGPQFNTYQIPDLVLSDTFNEWFTLTNRDIIDKLNRLKMYSIGTTGDGISAGTDSSGVLNIEIDSTVKKNMNFDGSVVFNGPVTTVNSRELTIDDWNIVLGATAEGATPAGISTAGGGGLLIKVKESPTGVTASWLYTVVAPEGINNLDDNYWKSSEHVLIKEGKRLLSGDQRVLIGNTAGSEALEVSFANRDNVFPAGSTGNYKDIVFKYSGLSASSIAGATTEIFRVSDDGRVRFLKGGHHKRISQANHGLTFGMAVYQRVDGNGYTAGIATSKEASEIIGVVSNVISGTTFDIQFSGEIEGDFSGVLPTGVTELSPGHAYFLDTTSPGHLNGGAPQAAGNIRKPIIVALEGNKALITNYIGGEIVDAVQQAAAGQSNQVTIEQIGHTFKVGDVIRYDMGVTGGSYTKAQANSEREAETVGIVIQTPVGDDENKFKIASAGYITGIGGLIQGDGLSAGAVYYLSANSAGSTTAASLTLTPPNSIGSVEKPMINATTSSSGYVLGYRGNVVSGVEETDKPELEGLTFKPVRKFIGLFKSVGFGNTRNDEIHPILSGYDFSKIPNPYHPNLPIGHFLENTHVLAYHIAIDGNIASKPVQKYPFGGANTEIWDPNTSTGADLAARYDLGSGNYDTGSRALDEYNSQGWPASTQYDGISDAGNPIGEIDADHKSKTGFGLPNSRVSIPQDAKFIQLRIHHNQNTHTNSQMFLWADKYDEERFVSNDENWLTVDNFISSLDPSAVNSEEEEQVTVVLPIDPDTDGSHIMLAVAGYFSEANGTYDYQIRIDCEGFYVDDPTVLIPKPFGVYRNSLINGNFDVWQRGNTFGNDNTITGTLTNSLASLEQVRANPYVSPLGQRGGAQADADIIKDQAYTCDRWKITNRSSDTYAITRGMFDYNSSTTTLPSEAASAKYYLKHNVSVAGNDQALSQRIEDVTTFDDESITLSFYYKKLSDVDFSGTSTVDRIKANLSAFSDGVGSNLANTDATSDAFEGSPLHGSELGFKFTSLGLTGPTFVVTEDWQKYKHTYTVPSIKGQLDQKGRGVTAGKGFWQLDLRPDSTTTVGWHGEMHFAQVQLERGRRATQFESLPKEITLQRCERYFQKSIPQHLPPGSDDAALGGFNSTTEVKDDAVTTELFEYWSTPGCLKEEWQGSGGPSFRYKGTMRAVPEVLIYSPKDGERGNVFDALPSPDDNVEVDALTGVSDTGVTFFSMRTNDHTSNPIDSTWYWTADAEI